ncbi:hypothetical protein SDJN02_17834, partial [Cucurbita argyrosperma subsp. argyrosperma]
MKNLTKAEPPVEASEVGEVYARCLGHARPERVAHDCMPMPSQTLYVFHERAEHTSGLGGRYSDGQETNSA